MAKKRGKKVVGYMLYVGDFPVTGSFRYEERDVLPALKWVGGRWFKVKNQRVQQVSITQLPRWKGRK